MPESEAVTVVKIYASVEVASAQSTEPTRLDTLMEFQSRIVDVDKQGATVRWVRSKHRDAVPEHQKRVRICPLTNYDITTIAALAHGPTGFG